jgi:hypothetical protein
MKPIHLTAPYYVSVGDNRCSTDVELRIEASRERRQYAHVRNERALQQWRERFERAPDVDAEPELPNRLHGPRTFFNGERFLYRWPTRS